MMNLKIKTINDGTLSINPAGRHAIKTRAEHQEKENDTVKTHFRYSI